MILLYILLAIGVIAIFAGLWLAFRKPRPSYELIEIDSEPVQVEPTNAPIYFDKPSPTPIRHPGIRPHVAGTSLHGSTPRARQPDVSTPYTPTPDPYPDTSLVLLALAVSDTPSSGNDSGSSGCDSGGSNGCASRSSCASSSSCSSSSCSSSSCGGGGCE